MLVSPEFTESRSVLYKNIDPILAPGAIYQYANTGSRTFSIQGKFISRSINEATKNLTMIQYLRTWAMPVFGAVGKGPAVGEDILGAPPAILFLTAYSLGNPLQNSQKDVPVHNVSGSNQFLSPDTSNNPPYVGGSLALGNNIYEVPVVITNLEIPFPADVDYIPTVNQVPVPTVVTVSIQLVETHSPNKYASFTLQDFKAGNLVNF